MNRTLRPRHIVIAGSGSCRIEHLRGGNFKAASRESRLALGMIAQHGLLYASGGIGLAETNA
jgi:hypothetical protein